ncbi:MAG: riboflavin synthase [Verrucomicrobia bacterium]|nr:riboflavin synthase [Verrucomicrobiota bacterium]
MFTGLVEEQGTVAAFSADGGGWRLQVSARAVLDGVAIGDSIAVNGCCLTVTHADRGSLTFDVLGETRRLTSFASLKKGGAVNLERSLRFDGKVGGHFVTGHIDGTGVIELVERRGPDTILRVGAPKGSGRHLISKGSIAVDGVSLTLAEVGGDSFSVWLIPHPLAATNLGAKEAGDLVNLEFDLLGKYVEKLLAARQG